MTVSRIAVLGLGAVLSAGSFVAVRAEEPKPEAGAAATTQKAQPIDFRKLKEVLPAELAGVKRTKADGERTAFGDFKLSVARGEYVADAEKEDAPDIRVEISDYGAMPGMAEGMAFWAGQEIDQEGDEGYTRSLKVHDQPALEQYTNDGKSGQLQVHVNKRFFVNVNTTNLSVEQFKKIADELPIRKLAELKE